MIGPNLSDWALKHRSFVVFTMIAIVVAGGVTRRRLVLPVRAFLLATAAVFVVIGVSTVAIPVVMYNVMGERARPMLERDSVHAHGRLQGLAMRRISGGSRAAAASSMRTSVRSRPRAPAAGTCTCPASDRARRNADAFDSPSPTIQTSCEA